MLLVVGRCRGAEVLIPNRSFPNQSNFYLTRFKPQIKSAQRRRQTLVITKDYEFVKGPTYLAFSTSCGQEL